MQIQTSKVVKYFPWILLVVLLLTYPSGTAYIHVNCKPSASGYGTHPYMLNHEDYRMFWWKIERFQLWFSKQYIVDTVKNHDEIAANVGFTIIYRPMCMVVAQNIFDYLRSCIYENAPKSHHLRTVMSQ